MIWVGFGAETITCAPVMAFTSRGQFPGSLTLSCMCTIAYCTQHFHKSGMKTKNMTQTQKSPLQTTESAAEIAFSSICIRPVSSKNKSAILKRECVFCLVFIQNILHIAQAKSVQ